MQIKDWDYYINLICEECRELVDKYNLNFYVGYVFMGDKLVVFNLSPDNIIEPIFWQHSFIWFDDFKNFYEYNKKIVFDKLLLNIKTQHHYYFRWVLQELELCPHPNPQGFVGSEFNKIQTQMEQEIQNYQLQNLSIY